ncbi:MAG TPA: twin-arginine translocase TatA/TatE family subunit [Opitutae bacterium]|nr:twin-arginine translocase TatA/TatE family subunit [Opitutae bacterium]
MTEIIVLLAIIALFFGAKRLPALVRSVGVSIGEFKRGMAADADSSIDREP